MTALRKVLPCMWKRLPVRDTGRSAELNANEAPVPSPRTSCCIPRQEINKEKLSAATKEICEQIKNMLDRGELDPDKKDKLHLERLLKELVEPKRKPQPDPKDQPDLRR